MIYIRVLLENTSCCKEVDCRHGLSIYVRTPNHRLLFDMGPDDTFLRNARNLDIDPAQVDIAVLSHGHHDHGGGLETFFTCNADAPLYLRQAALGEFYSQAQSPEPRYIGLEAPAKTLIHRMQFVEDVLVLDPELTFFTVPAPQDPVPVANSKLRRKAGEAYLQDDFRHELNLLITVDGTAVLLAGCAHNGIVPIMQRCVEVLGRAPDVVLGGFHLFSPGSGVTEPEEVLLETGKTLARWPTRYYTGHCTGQVAFDRLHAQLGDQLLHMQGGLQLYL